MTSRLRRLIKRYRNLAQQAKPFKSIPAQAIDLLIHRLGLNIHPADYYQMQFYKPDKTWRQKQRTYCLGGSLYWPLQNNPLRYNVLFTDKYIEKFLLKGMGLPITPVLSSAGKNRPIDTRQALEDFLQTLNTDIVIKPVSGMGGNNILVLERSGSNFIASGSKMSTDDIWNHIGKDYARGVLIEQRMHNTGFIEEVYPPSLNTFRVVTLRTDDMKWHCSACILKLGRGGHTVDNVGNGGIVVLFDANGKTRFAFDALHNRPVMQHPDTRIPLLDVYVDGHHDAIALGLEASKKFPFMGAIGWDIAMTPQGPLIVEGNLWLSCIIPQLYGEPLISDDIAAGLKPRRFFSRWDRAYMYPGFTRKKTKA